MPKNYDFKYKTSGNELSGRSMVAQTEAALSDLSRVAFEAKELAQDSATATAAAKGYAEQAKQASEAAVIASNAAQQAANNAETAADSAQFEAQQAQIAAEDSANSAAEAAQVSSDSLAIANDAKRIAQNAEQSATTAKDSATAKASEAAASAQAAAASVASIDPATIVRVLSQTFSTAQQLQACKNINALSRTGGEVIGNVDVKGGVDISGDLSLYNALFHFLASGDNDAGLDVMAAGDVFAGAVLSLRENTAIAEPGGFSLRTGQTQAGNQRFLSGKVSGSLRWNLNEVSRFGQNHRVIDIPHGATGMEITSPINGVIEFVGATIGNNVPGLLEIVNSTTAVSTSSGASVGWMREHIWVNQGDKVTLFYYNTVIKVLRWIEY